MNTLAEKESPWSEEVLRFPNVLRSDLARKLVYTMFVVNNNTLFHLSLREKCPYSELLRSVFSHIRAEYGVIHRIPTYSVEMREIRTRTTPGTDTFYAVCKERKV